MIEDGEGSAASRKKRKLERNMVLYQEMKNTRNSSLLGKYMRDYSYNLYLTKVINY